MLIDHMDCGIVLYDKHDRLVLCNEDFRRLYAPLADALVPGRRFEDTLRLAVARGLVRSLADGGLTLLGIIDGLPDQPYTMTTDGSS